MMMAMQNTRRGAGFLKKKFLTFEKKEGDIGLLTVR
jgi:hypothetical protein